MKMKWTTTRQHIRERAKYWVEAAHVTEPPVPVERIARLRGVHVRYVPFEGELSGLVFHESGKIIIGVNAAHSKTRQRFTLAHELGHLELHQRQKEEKGEDEEKDLGDLRIDRNFRVMRRDKQTEQATDPAEIEANAFAANLLMPDWMIAQDLAGLALDVEEDASIRTLADRYRVSLQAMVYRLTNLGWFQMSEEP